MRRALPVLIVGFALVACAGPTLVTPSPAVSPSGSVAPTSTASPTRPSPTRTPTPEPTEDPFATAPPATELVVPLDEVPAFPTPLLVDGDADRPALGAGGCPTIYYEPQDDPYGRIAEYVSPTCPSVVVTLGQPIEITNGGELLFRAPPGWAMGAQVIRGTAALWVVGASPLESAAPGVRMIDAGAGPAVELASDEGFSLLEVFASAPTDPGDYLAKLEAQMGQVDRTWRASGLTYYWWIRVR